MQIDLNADLGEGGDADEALLGLVSSANIACGWHAGGANAMRDCVRHAVQRGVAIGAHPSFHDPANFGRKEMHLPPDDIYAGTLYQLGALSAIAQAEGVRVAHLKAHGALYNQAARDPAIAEAIISAVHDFDPSVAVFGLANSRFIAMAREAGLIAIEEGFADRGYRDDGSLVPRSEPGALIDDEDVMLEHVLSMVRDKRVRSISGDWVSLDVRTLCLHGDGPHALAFAQKLRRMLEANGIDVHPASSLQH